MERKRELTSVDLAALVGELRDFCGAKVAKAYRYGEDLVRLRMRHVEHGRVELLVEVGAIKRAHAADPTHVPDAPTRPPNFAKMLRNRLSGATWTSVEQHNFDRVLSFGFDRPDENTTVVAELFGEGNVVVCDETDQVVDALRTVRLRSRTIAPGSPYAFPDAPVNPLELDFESFLAVMEASDSDVVRTIATQLNLGGRYAEEVCTRAEVEKELAIDAAGEDTFERVYDEIQALAATIRDRAFDPRVYYEDGSRLDVAPIALSAYAQLDSEPFDSFNDAVDDYFTHFEEEEEEDTASERPDFAAEIARTERIIEQQREAIEAFEKDAAQTRASAEALYANYELADEVLTAVRSARTAGDSWETIRETFEEAAAAGNERAAAVAGVDGAEGTVAIDLGEHVVDLEVGAGVEKNADRLYQEAKAIEEKKAGAEAAIAETKVEREEIRQRRDEWTPPDDAEPAEDEDDTVDWVSRSSIPIRESDEWYERFRWFHTSDEFLVIGGRHADQNEELVRKYLDPGDRFLHADAHGGPVTILKATGPSEASREVTFPDRTLREAAQFAISYSSVWKDGRFAGDAYAVAADQVSKEAESGEYLQKGGFVVRGDRDYLRNVPVGVAIGITCEPTTRVIGGPPVPIEERAEVAVAVEPGDVAQGDVAKRIYRHFREAFTDTSFVRNVASPDRIQEFLPPGRSAIVDEEAA